MAWLIENYTDTPTATLERLTWEYLEDTTGEIDGVTKQGSLFCDTENRFTRFITAVGEVLDEVNEDDYRPEI